MFAVLVLGVALGRAAAVTATAASRQIVALDLVGIEKAAMGAGEPTCGRADDEARPISASSKTAPPGLVRGLSASSCDYYLAATPVLVPEVSAGRGARLCRGCGAIAARVLCALGLCTRVVL